MAQAQGLLVVSLQVVVEAVAQGVPVQEVQVLEAVHLLVVQVHGVLVPEVLVQEAVLPVLRVQVQEALVAVLQEAVLRPVNLLAVLRQVRQFISAFSGRLFQTAALIGKRLPLNASMLLASSVPIVNQWHLGNAIGTQSFMVVPVGTSAIVHL